MSMNLVGIAGVPAQDMSGKLIGVGGCGCSGMGADLGPTDEQRSAFNWMAIGLLGGAVVIAMVLFQPQPGRHRR